MTNLRVDMDWNERSPQSSLDKRNQFRLRIRAFSTETLSYYGTLRDARDTMHFIAHENAETIIERRVRGNKWEKIESLYGMSEGTMNNIERAVAPRKIWDVQGNL